MPDLSMVEKVARAILAGHDWTGDVTGEPDEACGWDSLSEDWKNAYRNMGRAMIQAALSEAPADA